MTHAQAHELAQAAVDRMCDDPQIWLTHGCPGEPKLGRIADIITETILSAMLAKQAAEEWRASTEALISAESKRKTG